MGVPSVFVRTSGCNLRCTWCDTPYASWQPEGDEWSLEEIVRRVVAFRCRHAVVTGGEPMIAKDMPALLRRLRETGHHITIETAATIAPPPGLACDLASLSPKLANSTPSEEKAGAAWAARHEERRLQPEVIRAWIGCFDFQLKFVVRAESDLAEIEALLAAIRAPQHNAAPPDIPPEKILLMPEGTDAATLARRALWLVEICKQRGHRYCPRLHVDLFGHTRGT